MRTITFILLFLIAGAVGYGQTSKWEMKLGTDIYNPTLSPDGRHLMFFTNDDSVVVHCVNVVTGAKEWERTLKKFKEYRVGRFIGNDTMLVGQETRYEFLSTRDGSVLKTLPIVGDDWRDIIWQDKAGDGDDTLKPHFDGNIAIFYFDDGMQILDLSTASIIHQTETSPRVIRYKKWESVLMINPTSGADSVYFIDVNTRKLVYTAVKDKNDINSSVYQPFVVSLSTLLLFNEDNIESIDLTTGKQNAIIDVDPDDPELYAPVIFKNSLSLMVSDDGVQKMYDSKTGKLLWQTAQDSVPGVVEQIVELPNDEGLMMTYEADGKMKTYKVDTKTGKVIWARPLFVQDGKFEPGHKEGSKVWATIGKIALTVLSAYLTRGSNAWRSNYRTGMMENDPFRWNRYDFSEQQRYRRDINDAYNSWINKKKKSDGYVTLLNQDEKSVMLVSAGKVYNAADNGTAKEYDGEGITKLNLADGTIATQTKASMLSSSEKHDFNAAQDLNIQKFDSARTLLGVHDLYVLRGYDVEHFNYGEQTLEFINTGKNEMTFIAKDDDNDVFDYWRVDVSGATTKRYLIARSYKNNLVFGDSSHQVSTTLLVAEDSIAAYHTREGDITPGTFSGAKWTLNEKDLDKMDLGDLYKNVSAYDSLQGIRIYDGDVVLMGDDGIGYVSSDGSCRWSSEWSPKLYATKLGVKKVGDGIVYSTNGVTQILPTACPLQKVTEEISYSDTMVLTSPGHDVVVLDTDDGIIHGYHLK